MPHVPKYGVCLFHVVAVDKPIYLMKFLLDQSSSYQFHHLIIHHHRHPQSHGQINSISKLCGSGHGLKGIICIELGDQKICCEPGTRLMG